MVVMDDRLFTRRGVSIYIDMKSCATNKVVQQDVLNLQIFRAFVMAFTYLPSHLATDGDKIGP